MIISATLVFFFDFAKKMVMTLPKAKNTVPEGPELSSLMQFSVSNVLVAAFKYGY